MNEERGARRSDYRQLLSLGGRASPINAVIYVLNILQWQVPLRVLVFHREKLALTGWGGGLEEWVGGVGRKKLRLTSAHVRAHPRAHSCTYKGEQSARTLSQTDKTSSTSWSAPLQDGVDGR